MQRIPVRLCVDNYIVEIQIPAAIHDPNGYFSTIGYENLTFQTVPRNWYLSVYIVNPRNIVSIQILTEQRDAKINATIATQYWLEYKIMHYELVLQSAALYMASIFLLLAIRGY
jgi:hypothetical protein